MAFHVEIRRSLQRAWAFNLGDAELRGTILEPWRRGVPVKLGDQEWDPGKSRLTVLEGPRLAPPDLAVGQGWNSAARSARDVTTHVLAPAEAVPGHDAGAVALLASTPAAAEATADALRLLALRVVDWLPVRARLLTDAMLLARPRNERAGLPATVVAIDDVEPPDSWLFDAGVALGALGGSAILVALGTKPLPPALEGLGVVRLEPSLHPLAERLRRAGCAVGPVPE